MTDHFGEMHKIAPADFDALAKRLQQPGRYDPKVAKVLSTPAPWDTKCDKTSTPLVQPISMSNLSPTAQKVLRADAARRCLAEWSSVNDPPCHPSDEGWSGCGTCVNRAAIAAALEAAADQLKYKLLGVEVVDCSQLRLLADELEAHD